MSLVVSFGLDEGMALDKEMISRFIDNVAFFIAIPFIRETLQSMSARLGLNPLTLGMLKTRSAASLSASLRDVPLSKRPTVDS